MKKVIAVLLAIGMVLAFAACAKPAADDSGTYEIVLVTDVGNIDDASFNQGSWEGVKEYAEANGKTYNYFRPSEDSTEARVETIKSAIDKGAKVLVCPGFLFEDAIYEVQGQFPEVQFLLIDGEPHNTDYSVYETTANTHCILYQEEQAGYFAGYAAVKDGYTKLGFLGGVAVPPVIRFGFGFVQGVNDAAKELGNTADIEIKYWYSDSFLPSDDIKTKMSGWCTEGTEIIFSCGGKIALSAIAAAEEAGAKLIGVDVDQAGVSDLIVTSAMKELKTSVILSLTDLYANGGTWPESYAGKTANLGAAEACVGLPTAEASWRFNTFTVEEYEALFTMVKSGTITISNAIDVEPTVDIAVDYQK